MMKRGWVAWVFVSFFSLSGANAQVSTESQFPQEGPSANRQARNLGMGNVGIAIRGSHDSSPFYNPAGLNDLEDGRFEFLSPTFEISNGAIGLINDMVDLGNDLEDANNSAQRTDVLDAFIGEHRGDFRRVRFTFEIFNYATKNFAGGVLIDEKFDNSFRNPTFPNFQLKNEGDVIAYFSAAHDFWDKLLQVGVTFRPTFRFAIDEGDQEVTYADVVTEDAEGDPIFLEQLEKIKNERFGLGVDVGLKSHLASLPALKDLGIMDLLKPQIGFVWNDIGSPSYGGSAGTRQSIGVGIAIHPDFWKLKNTVALDFRDLNRGRAFISKLHFGVETQFPWILGLRAGVNQGYITGGLTADFKFVKLEGAVYFEEVGPRTYENGDLRFIGSLSFKI